MRLKSPTRGIFDIVQRVVEQRRQMKRSSTLRLEGLRHPVEVLTDGWGVPHIYADNTHDLFFAQGYVTARDRLFQMDYNRHAASGRLCELVGRRPIPWRHLTVHLKERDTLDVDVLLRTFGMARSAEASLAIHSSEAQDFLRCYAAGVNSWISSGTPTLEHRLLRCAPSPWTEVDSITMLRAIGFELNFAWRAILLGAMMGAAGLPEDVARVLCPHAPAGGSTIVHQEAWAAMARDLALTRHAAEVALGIGNASAVGSNSFVIAGSHSKNGDALLANDTHLKLTAPLPWHEVHLVGGGLDLHGYALSGVPGVAIGRAASHVWGITAGLVQDLDLFVEKLHPDAPHRYLTPDGWQTLYEHHEVFNVRGEGEHRRVIYESRHGPLLESLATMPEPNHRFAIAWSGSRPGRDLDALIDTWRARSFEDARHALRHITCPPYSITYAGADGRVGYALAGVIPRRRLGTPLRPLEGWTGEWDWQGTVPFELNPWQADPEQGFIITANNRVIPRSYPYELGNLFELPYRYDRIRERLAALGDQITLEDLAAIQCDTYSAWGIDAREAILAVAGGAGAFAGEAQSSEREALDIWLAWDGMADHDSAGAAIGLVTAISVGREIVRRLTGDDAAMGFAEMASLACNTVVALPRIADRLAELGIDLADVARQSFRKTLAICRDAMGSEPAEWRWGTLHPLVVRHRLDGTPLAPLFNIGPEPAGGGPNTVNRGDTGANRFDLSVGPAMRWVASARDRDATRTIMPGGQSGSRWSSHYDDQLGEFLSGRLKPSPVSREAIAVEVCETMIPADK